MRHAYILHLNVIQIEASHKKKMSIWKMFHSLHSFHDADFAYRLVMFIPISMHVKYKLSSASGEFFSSPAFNISDVDKTENTKATWNLKKRFNDAWNQLTMYRVWLKFVLNLSQVPRISNTCSPFFSSSFSLSLSRPLLCACTASNSMKKKLYCHCMNSCCMCVIGVSFGSWWNCFLVHVPSSHILFGNFKKHPEHAWKPKWQEPFNEVPYLRFTLVVFVTSR